MSAFAEAMSSLSLADLYALNLKQTYVLAGEPAGENYWVITRTDWNKIVDAANKTFQYLETGYLALADIQREALILSAAEVVAIQDQIIASINSQATGINTTLGNIFRFLNDEIRNYILRIVPDTSQKLDDVRSRIQTQINDLGTSTRANILEATTTLTGIIERSAAATRDQFAGLVSNVGAFLQNAPEDIAYRIWVYFRDFIWEPK